MSNLFTAEKEAWLFKARMTARELLRYEDKITIEDVIRQCPRPQYLHRNTNGAVFNDDFESVGFTKALHKEAKGRWIQQWRVRRPERIYENE